MFESGHVVLNATTGKRGLVVPDFMGCCSREEVPVLYEGEPGFLGTDRATLEDLGPENPVADPRKCGAGLGPKCCIFIMAGEKGFECHRTSELRNSLIWTKHTMNAQREPTAPFPNCQIADEPKKAVREGQEGEG